MVDTTTTPTPVDQAVDALDVLAEIINGRANATLLAVHFADMDKKALDIITKAGETLIGFAITERELRTRRL